ncbi:LADA_0F15104g1_1 [Lachancea dasiensis]|uniref:LADA_0F15104g1_1 n=1 Tax=Lachancea dasiensis TaxID=1072105 RepID=A0A1G4JNK0_9SACH|nr:LADA_0F15104g1_1 [Lachancea dasiensis]
MVYTVISATLSDNISCLSVKDTDDDLAEYALQLRCIDCREVNDSKVTVNRMEKYEMSSGKGEASLVMKCKFCGNDCSVNLEKYEEKLYNLDLEENGDVINKQLLQRKKKGIKKVEDSRAVALELDCRGCDVFAVDFSNLTFNVEMVSGNVLEASFGDENEWYDYDDKAGEEVSVTDMSFEVVKGK